MSEQPLPTGPVTFLFTDVEDSTKLLLKLGPEGYAKALSKHRDVLREAATSHEGVEVGTEGDACFFAFPTAPGAIEAASQAQRALARGPIRARMGLHTGVPLVSEGNYVGIDVHRAARIAAAGHGGQVLVSAATASLVERDRLLDLGEHRFKDLAAPERVYQLGKRKFPPIRSLYRTNLPVPLTPFLGREREISAIAGVVMQKDVHLLTLTGTGGTGKTRLALQVAAEVAETFPDGIWWVPLASLRDATLVLPNVAGALSVREERNRPLAETLQERLAGKRMLLLLDNAEHLLPGIAPDIGLLRDLGAVTVLVTSRERLRLPGERVWPVEGLDEADSVALFDACARSLRPSFQLTPAVEELCRRLDNLPLAIELAAARIPLFSPEELLERIGERLDLLVGSQDGDPRQQTLRATIGWSYDLLNAEERALFERLSVFVGGFTFAAAEEVCDATPDLLQSLIDKSLLRRRERETGESRYSMLETIREYANDRLQASGEMGEMRTRHAEHFLRFGEAGNAATTPFPELSDQPRSEPYRLAWRARMIAEQPNIAGGLTWFEQNEDPVGLLRIVAANWRTWESLGRVAHARSWIDNALLFRDRATPQIRSDLLLGAAELAILQGECELAVGYLEESLEVARAAHDTRREGESLLLAAGVESAFREFTRARKLYEQGAEAFASGDYQLGVAVSRVSLAELALADDEATRAVRLAKEARQLSDRIGWSSGIAWATIIEAAAQLRLGHSDQALQLAGKALEACLDLHLPHGVADCLRVIAAALSSTSDQSTAAQLLAASERLEKDLEVILGWAEKELHSRTLGTLKERLGSAALEAALSQGWQLTADQAVALAATVLPGHVLANLSSWSPSKMTNPSEGQTE